MAWSLPNTNNTWQDRSLPKGKPVRLLAFYQVCFCCFVASACANGLCELPIHNLYFSTRVIAFLLIYSRFYFCFVPLNSERIITPLPVTELWSLTDLSLNPGFPTHALRIYRQFTWPLWDLVTSNWELNEKTTAWHRIKAQCVVSAAAVFVLLFLLWFLHCIFSQKKYLELDNSCCFRFLDM